MILIINSILVTLGMMYGVPIAMQWIPQFFAVMIFLWGPLLITFLLIMKQNKWSLGKAFRIGPFNKKLFFISIGLFVLVQVLELSLGFSRELLSNLPFMEIGKGIPEIFHPHYEPKIPLGTFMGLDVKGHYELLLFWAMWLILNIGLEELLWRGYALPRMELRFGKYAWLVNGLLWNLGIHFFMRWSFITLLPISLILPYVAQKTKSIWPGVIIHGLGNLLLYVILIPSI